MGKKYGGYRLIGKPQDCGSCDMGSNPITHPKESAMRELWNVITLILMVCGLLFIGHCVFDHNVFAMENPKHEYRKWRGTGNDVQILEHMQKIKDKQYYATRGFKHDKMPKYTGNPKYKNYKFLGRVAWRDWFDYERYEYPVGVYHNDSELMLMYSYCDQNDVCFSIMIEDMGIKR